MSRTKLGITKLACAVDQTLVRGGRDRGSMRDCHFSCSACVQPSFVKDCSNFISLSQGRKEKVTAVLSESDTAYSNSKFA
jgi:hypothetical protein